MNMPYTKASTNVAPMLTNSTRVSSVDAYRGFVMLMMMAEVLHFGRISDAIPDSKFWSLLSYHWSHVPWVGCSLHDLIQPSFSFLVGVALPYSIASRATQSQNVSTMWMHTIKRSIILICLGIFLRSMHAEQTNFTFEDTLTQIGLGYPILFALGFQKDRIQWTALVLILFFYGALFAFHPLPGMYFDWQQTGITPDWPHNLTGFAAHWNKNTNAAWAFDQWFLNLFPRKTPFVFNGGGYSTLSFIPTTATMILGLIAGQWLREKIAPLLILRKLVITAVVLFSVALAMDRLGINPIVKRIWTPSWTLWSGGWCFMFLAAFYFIVDIKKKKSYFTWLIIVGMNSIAAYVLSNTLSGFIEDSLYIHLGSEYDTFLGIQYRTLVSGGLILLTQFSILKWMYNKKLFLKI
jgi:predicted acyltransferase